MEAPDYIVWLRTILIAKGHTQTALAKELGVTHATLNRWLHQKSQPHPQRIVQINELFQKYAFLEVLEKSFNLIKWRKKFLAIKNNSSLESLIGRKDFYEDSLLKLTYHSNKIEGSTLSLRETQAILFDNQVIPKHSLIEHLEVSNHRLAFKKILEAVQSNAPISIDFVLELHQILMSNILGDAGCFRTHPVRIVGARVVPPNYLKVPEKIKLLCKQMDVTHDPIGMLVQHAQFEAIHPFSDGNGRLGRLLLNYQLLRSQYPLMVFHSENKHRYYEVLEKSQVQQIYEPLIKFAFAELLSSYSA